MTSAEDDLKRVILRQESLIAATHGLTDVVEQTRNLIVELMAWLQQPPSSELPDLIRTLTTAVQEQGGHMQTIADMLKTLPGDVARAVKTGEGA